MLLLLNHYIKIFQEFEALTRAIFNETGSLSVDDAVKCLRNVFESEAVKSSVKATVINPMVTSLSADHGEKLYSRVPGCSPQMHGHPYFTLLESEGYFISWQSLTYVHI